MIFLLYNWQIFPIILLVDFLDISRSVTIALSNSVSGNKIWVLSSSGKICDFSRTDFILSVISRSEFSRSVTLFVQSHKSFSHISRSVISRSVISRSVRVPNYLPIPTKEFVGFKLVTYRGALPMR